VLWPKPVFQIVAAISKQTGGLESISQGGTIHSRCLSPQSRQRSGGATFVPVMEPTDSGIATIRPASGAWAERFWRILLQAEVCTATMIVVRAVSEMVI
jgi:hypothetical protein